MLIRCDCGNETYRLHFAPPLKAFAECTECGSAQEVGGPGRGDTVAEAMEASR